MSLSPCGGEAHGELRMLRIMAISCLITGATGFVGSHLVEACAGRGWNVRALVPPSSDTSLLERHHATLIRGDLTDLAAVREALQGVEVVLHCAAKVGDWGPVEEYRTINVEALRGLLDVCRDRSGVPPLQRFVHFSSLGVYAARHHYGTDENEPLPQQHIDGYTQTKVESEQLVLSYYRDHKLPVVVLRPGFIYGTRDRTVMPKLLDNLRNGKLRYIGGGKRGHELHLRRQPRRGGSAGRRETRSGRPDLQPDRRRVRLETAFHREHRRRHGSAASQAGIRAAVACPHHGLVDGTRARARRTVPKRRV